MAHLKFNDRQFSGSSESPFYHHWEKIENRDFYTTQRAEFVSSELFGEKEGIEENNSRPSTSW